MCSCWYCLLQVARGSAQGQPTQVDQGRACDHVCESPGGSRGSSTGDCSTTHSLSGFKTALPMEVVNAGLPPAGTDKAGKVHAAPSSTSRAVSSECPPEGTRPKQRLYPTLPVEDDPPLALNREQEPSAGAAGSHAPFKMAVSHKGTLGSNPRSKVAERDPVDPRQPLPSEVKEAGEHVPYSPELPRVHPPLPPSLGKMPTPSAPPLPLSRPARGAGLQQEAKSSPLSPTSYALNEIKSGNRDPSAIRRGLAAMASTPAGSPGSESPASSVHSGKRKRHPSPSPSPGPKGVPGETSSKKACMSMGSLQKPSTPASAGRMNTPVIARGQSSEKKSGWLAKLFKS